jgi:UDP-GlcNAc:undecaprenyl-phosphate GlcNAc-1-phosphate transferase
MLQGVLAGILGLFSTAFFIPLFNKLAKKINLVDTPNHRKSHDKSIPCSGGFAIFCGFFLSLILLNLLNYNLASEFFGILIGGLLFIILGSIDDKKDIKAIYKLFLQILIISGVILIFKIKTKIFNNLYLDYIISLFLFLGFINGINLIDGINGLASGVVTVICITLSFVKLILNSEFDYQFLVLAGCCLAFLKANLIEGKLFLGDNGSLLLGFLIPAIMLSNNSEKNILGCTIALCITGVVPAADTIYAVIRRLKNKKPIFCADSEHIHHKLIKIGIRPRQVVLLLTSITLLFGLSAIIISLKLF